MMHDETHAGLKREQSFTVNHSRCHHCGMALGRTVFGARIYCYYLECVAQGSVSSRVAGLNILQA
jgi:hypothetical protein